MAGTRRPQILLKSTRTTPRSREGDSCISLLGPRCRLACLRLSPRVGIPGTAGLAAINGAIQALVKPLAAELKPIRVNAVSPGIIETAWWNRPGQEEQFAALKKIAAATSAGRPGRPEEVADAICFLIGNSLMTGVVIDCDGGLRVS